jgi:dipeptidase D
MNIRELRPAALWNAFADLNAIPRASKNEAAATAFAKAFGEKLGLETSVDSAGNVIIRKPGTAGKESLPMVLLQSHLDMVHQKNADVVFDFATQGIDMYVDGDWVKARGTTLGADNGIGVATIMALLESTDIPHPPLEALFTIDEETGMTGAFELAPGALQSRLMLNLDTEEDTELTIGCAGGIDVTASATYPATPVPDGHQAFDLKVSGLRGGHSGMDIHLGRGNANKLMNRILYGAVRDLELRIHRIDGGSLRNAIPRESVAAVTVPSENAAAFRSYLDRTVADIRKEYGGSDPDFLFTLSDAALPIEVVAETFASDFLRGIYSCPNGIYRMSPEVPGLVQTSNNIARVLLQDGRFSVQCLGRSAVDSEKMDLVQCIESAFASVTESVEQSGSYPGWAPRPDSMIVKLMSERYQTLFGDSANVSAVHAGLECGIIGAHYPDMEMISFGPNITGAHSPDEQVQISSVQKFWKYLLDVLDRVGA